MWRRRVSQRTTLNIRLRGVREGAERSNFRSPSRPSAPRLPLRESFGAGTGKGERSKRALTARSGAFPAPEPGPTAGNGGGPGEGRPPRRLRPDAPRQYHGGTRPTPPLAPPLTDLPPPGRPAPAPAGDRGRRRRTPTAGVSSSQASEERPAERKPERSAVTSVPQAALDGPP